MTATEALTFMRAVVGNVLRARNRQFLSAAFRINFSEGQGHAFARDFFDCKGLEDIFFHGANLRGAFKSFAGTQDNEAFALALRSCSQGLADHFGTNACRITQCYSNPVLTTHGINCPPFTSMTWPVM